EMFIAPKNQRAQDYHHIDPKIAPLVSALNQLPRVETIASAKVMPAAESKHPMFISKRITT
ncbi:hypothetical protein ACPV5U_29580, partial [Vibrio mediterranei]